MPDRHPRLARRWTVHPLLKAPRYSSREIRTVEKPVGCMWLLWLPDSHPMLARRWTVHPLPPKHLGTAVKEEILAMSLWDGCCSYQTVTPSCRASELCTPYLKAPRYTWAVVEILGQAANTARQR